MAAKTVETGRNSIAIELDPEYFRNGTQRAKREATKMGGLFTKPRIFDELSSSHEIVHRGRQDTISAGITVVNIAETYVSPTRQKSSHELEVTRHKQPHDTERMIKHLRGLQIRENIDEVGFDAYCTVVIDCDNQSDASLWTGHPAPQQGDPDHYDTFRGRIVRFYNERFSSLV